MVCDDVGHRYCRPFAHQAQGGNLVENFALELRSSVKIHIHGTHAEANYPGETIVEEYFEDGERLAPCISIGDYSTGNFGGVQRRCVLGYLGKSGSERHYHGSYSVCIFGLQSVQ